MKHSMSLVTVGLLNNGTLGRKVAVSNLKWPLGSITGLGNTAPGFTRNMTHLSGRSLHLPITRHPTKAEMELFSSTGILAGEAQMACDPPSPAVILVTESKKSLPKLKTQGIGKTRDKILMFLDLSSPWPHLLFQRRLHRSHSSSSLLKCWLRSQRELWKNLSEQQPAMARLRSDFSSSFKAPTFFLH